MRNNILISEIFGSVAKLTINRPNAMNSLSSALRLALSHKFKELNEDPEVKVIILTAAGEKAFSAGIDLKELGNGQSSMIDIVGNNPLHNVGLAMDMCSKPIIGAINGATITGGLELALACDLLIASSKARFADTHALVEAVPAWGLSQRLSRLVGISRAKEMSLTGQFIDAETALSWGLINHVVKPEDLSNKTMEIAEKMSKISQAMLIRYKSLIDRGADLNLGEALVMERTEAQQAAAAVTPESIETKRQSISERNRNQ